MALVDLLEAAFRMNGFFYIETYGCQMNKYDSELMAGILTDEGYKQTLSLEKADIVLINTCSVRNHAEQRVLGRLGELKRFKDKNPNLIVGLCGCMAQRLGTDILHKVPHVDAVVGPDAYRRLPEIVRNLNGRPTCDVALGAGETYTNIHPERTSQLKAWVAIMRGCDNFCSYCIVPFVRGPARSRPLSDILSEVTRLIREGCQDITLLGQNVNGYLHDGIGFAELLRELNAVEGRFRIRFTTSHPKDMSPEIIDSIAEGDHICEHIHLPLQSGSTQILRAMNRKYSGEDYLTLVKSIRAAIPGVSVTTDVIVGFPGETEEEYEKTLEMVETVAFDSAFTFRYSPRPGTTAAELQDDIPEHVKIERLERLIALQRSITDRKNREYVGREVEVLVEGESRKGGGQLMGRTRTDKTVVFDGDKKRIGACLPIRIESAKGWTLWGKRIEAQ